MGGKFWSKEEQYYFVHTVMRLSRFNGPNGEYNANYGMPWPDLANMMQRDMDFRGLTRRTYTGNMLYEHWYQTVRKWWGDAEARRIRATAPREARGKVQRSRVEKTKRRAKKEPSSSSAPIKNKSPANGPSGPCSSQLSPSASDYPQLGGFAAPESQYTGFAGPQVTPGRYPGPPTVSGPPSSSQFNPYGASDAPYLTHAEGAALYHQQHQARRPERRRGPFPRVNEDGRDPVAPAAFNHSINHSINHHRQRLIIREPTPEEDDMDGSSLFVQQFEHEFNRGVPAPRARVELDAAHTMTMFRDQEMHTLHGAPPPRHSVPAAASRSLMQEHRYEHQDRAISGPRLAPMIPREYAPYRSQEQRQFEEDEADLSD
ncbi:hypothetical protein EYC84_007851 [Monilinia fructicola]|uniref:Myb/SANT-like domain-containing protein n=1 Tax=Monilinia fructicola TaxID=38448 RepID=A0A5M9JM39_MONFR|nr:hypothetical protein EYC84_007851 [Monilinia fructicola]